MSKSEASGDEEIEGIGVVFGKKVHELAAKRSSPNGGIKISKTAFDLVVPCKRFDHSEQWCIMRVFVCVLRFFRFEL